MLFVLTKKKIKLEKTSSFKAAFNSYDFDQKNYVLEIGK